MIITILLMALFISFFIHIFFLIKYILTKEKRFLRLFLFTAGTNFLVAIILIIVALNFPEDVQKVDLSRFFWFLSGLIMFLGGGIQIAIFRHVWKRAHQPENFHYNFFGKKVLHPGVIKPVEFSAFFGSIPFFLIAGGYFVAKLINFLKMMYFK